jgi:WD40 repeat protein
MSIKGMSTLSLTHHYIPPYSLYCPCPHRSIHVCSVSSLSSSAIRTFTGHTDEVNGVCWSPGGIYLASCSDDSTAKIWSLEPSKDSEGLVHDLRGHSKEIYTVRWTPTGPCSANPDKPLLLCTASFDGTVKVSYKLSVGMLFYYVLMMIAVEREHNWLLPCRNDG